MAGITPKLPLFIDGINGIALITTYKELVKQNFKNLLFTIPGERVMDADFGVGLKRYLFELDNPGLHGQIAGRIRQQVEKYLPYVTIDDVVFNTFASNPALDPNFLGVAVEYTIVPLDDVDKLELTLPID